MPQAPEFLYYYLRSSYLLCKFLSKLCYNFAISLNSMLKNKNVLKLLFTYFLFWHTGLLRLLTLSLLGHPSKYWPGSLLLNLFTVTFLNSEQVHRCLTSVIWWKLVPFSEIWQSLVICYAYLGLAQSQWYGAPSENQTP